MPKEGDILSYIHEGYSTMMFVDEVTDVGFFYWSIQVLNDSLEGSVTPSRKFMATMLDRVFHWTPVPRELAAASLLRCAMEGIDAATNLMEALKELNAKEKSEESYKELVALGMEINLNSERHYALGKMGKMVFSDDEEKNASSSHWLP